MNLWKQSLKLLTLIIILFLSSCKNKSQPELEKYIASVNSRAASSSPAIYEFKTPTKISYQNEKLRSPFQSSPSQHNDLHRAREPLEAFELSSLRMVGMIWRDQKMWGLIAAPNNQIYKVTLGTYIGPHSGRVLAITKNKIEIEETISSGAEHREQKAVVEIRKK